MVAVVVVFGVDTDVAVAPAVAAAAACDSAIFELNAMSWVVVRKTH